MVDGGAPLTTSTCIDQVCACLDDELRTNTRGTDKGIKTRSLGVIKVHLLASVNPGIFMAGQSFL